MDWQRIFAKCILSVGFAFFISGMTQEHLVKTNTWASPQRHVGVFSTLEYTNKMRMFLVHPACEMNDRFRILSLAQMYIPKNYYDDVFNGTCPSPSHRNPSTWPIVANGIPNADIERLISDSSCENLHYQFNLTHIEAMRTISSNISHDQAHRIESTLRSMLECVWIRGPWTTQEETSVLAVFVFMFVALVVRLIFYNDVT